MRSAILSLVILAACGGSVEPEPLELARADAAPRLEASAPAPLEGGATPTDAPGERDTTPDAPSAPRCAINDGGTAADMLPCIDGPAGPTWEWLEPTGWIGCSVAPCPLGAACRAGPNLGVCR